MHFDMLKNGSFGGFSFGLLVTEERHTELNETKLRPMNHKHNQFDRFYFLCMSCVLFAVYYVSR